MNFNAGSAAVISHWQRTYDRAGPAWLVSLFIGDGHTCSQQAPGAWCPQSMAVVDDFGTLVIVEGWQ